MTGSNPINLPANYAQAVAVGYADGAGNISLVGTGAPLPVSLDSIAPPPPPLVGTISQSGSIGPFAPVAGTPVTVQLSGTWSGSVQLARSSDNGASRWPVTAAGLEWARFTANACEQVWQESEAGVLLYLDVTLSSGTLVYRVAQ
ncbi:MAG: hypothetical protein ACREBO_01010 [Novosphingobium sp.]